jgi:hypothetical protein
MKRIVLIIITLFVFAGLPSISKATSNDELLQQIKMLQQKLIELEKKVENQQASIEETKKNSARS